MPGIFFFFLFFAQPAVVCAECDRLWLDSEKVGIHNDEQLEDALNKIGMTADWSNLERVQHGVPWDKVDEEYQLILKKRQKTS
jgi:hypothetical protein